MTTIRRTLPSLLTALEREVAEKDDAVARGLVHAIKCYKSVATIYLWSDVLPHLSTRSLVFQRDAVDLCMIEPQVAATVASIKFLRNQPGPYLTQLDDTISKLSSEFGLKVTDNLKQQFKQSIREKYIDQVVVNLENRFSDSHLLSALVTIFHPSKAAKSKQSSTSRFDSYGDAAVDTLAAKFTTSVIKERLQLEWMGFNSLKATGTIMCPW